LFGGDGGLSGVPRHLGQICETISNTVDLTVASDRNVGGFDHAVQIGACHVEMEGLRSSLWPVSIIKGWIGAHRLLTQQKWDLVWLHARLPAILVRLAFALGFTRLHNNAHIVMSYHGIPFDPGQRRIAARVSRMVESFLLSRCPQMHLIFLSSDMVSRLRDVVGSSILDRHKIHVLPNSSNLGTIPRETTHMTKRNLVITGRAGYQKNYALAVRLMDHLPENYILTLCGNGTDDRSFQSRLLRQVRAQTRARIQFSGPVVDVGGILAMADCYLLTSRYEGLPIGAIEAFEMGLPLVLTPFEAAPEMVAAHPLAMCLPLQDLPRDAVRIARLVETYRKNRAAYSDQIKLAWKRKYPYAAWQARVRNLMQEILADKIPNHASFVHDVR